jgi:fission process protein 1
MTMSQIIVERSTFQLFASLVLPALFIHTCVDVAKFATKKMGRFQKWGPSVFGLACIPFLPLYLDHPVEHAIEQGFSKYGPWATAKDGDKKND